MDWMLFALGLAFGLFLAMLGMSEIGRRIALRRLRLPGEGLAKGIGAAEGAVFGLLGLLMAFTFSGAATRFEERRHLITEEANAIGTAYLRLDLLPDDLQPGMRELFKRYTDARAVVYADVVTIAATQAKLDKTTAMQGEIWQRAISACRQTQAQPSCAMLLLPALNGMIDITTTRVMATRNHPPQIIFWMLTGLSLIGALLVGYGMAENRLRSWLHVLAFAAVVSLAVYVIIDVEYPRMGLIRVDAADQLLVELGNSMR